MIPTPSKTNQDRIVLTQELMSSDPSQVPEFAPPAARDGWRSQTRRVAKVSMIALLVSLGISSISILNKGRIAPLDAYNVFNAEIMGHWVGRVGFIPLAAVLVTIAMTFRNAPLLSSLLNLVGAVAGIAIAISGLVIAAAALQPTKTFPLRDAGADRDEFVGGVVKTCSARQHQMPENRGVTEQAVSIYCTCFAKLVADSMTIEDMKYQDRYGIPSDATKKVMAEGHPKCAAAAQ